VFFNRIPPQRGLQLLPSGQGGEGFVDIPTGSHNVVVGQQHNFSRIGGLMVEQGCRLVNRPVAPGEHLLGALDV
jgi:hypothetical protein